MAKTPARSSKMLAPGDQHALAGHAAALLALLRSPSLVARGDVAAKVLAFGVHLQRLDDANPPRRPRGAR